MPWSFDPRALRYRDGETGRFLPRGRALELANQVIDTGGEAANVLADMVTDGRLSPFDWHERMRREIKDAYVQQYLLGRGGRAQMTQADWGSVGGSISDQYRHLDRKLDNFYSQVQAGEMTAGTVAARSNMYINSAREAYERGLKRRLRGSAYDEERWVLGDAEHCDDCVALAARGWVPFGALPTVPGAGQTACLTNCQCHIEYRRSDTGEQFEAEAEGVADAA